MTRRRLTAAAACAEGGHWWGDEPFLVRFFKGRNVGERNQECQRGCGRTRRTRISITTGEMIGSHAYGGTLGVARSAYNKATIRATMIGS